MSEIRIAKRLLLTAFVLLAGMVAVQAQDKVVILTAGQSNTAGRCDNANLPDYVKALGTAYRYCNWSYTNASNRKSESEGVFRKYWPERENNGKQFAYDAIVYYWVEKALQQDFYVVKHAMGGTSIDPTCQSSGDHHWSADPTWLAANASANEDGHSMLKAFVSNIGKSLDAITAKGETPDVKCMIWHQGESDRSGTGPDGYHDNLKAVVKYVRDYLVEKTGQQRYATLPFICGTVPTNSKQYNKKVYDALFTLQGEDPNFHVIETSPGTFIGDQLHFDSNCAERLGIGMYNKMVDLGLISGEKQTVPDPILPEKNENTLDFKGWTENMGLSNSEYLNIVLDETAMQAADGTPVYKAVGCSGDADFSEFAETFALAANTTSGNDKVRFRGVNGLFLASKQQTVFSLLNLQAGDVVSFDCSSGTSGAQSLFFLSENAYLKSDASKTVIAKDTYLENKTEYVIASGTQLDLTFGDGSASHTIRTITVVPFQNGAEPGGPVEPQGDEPTEKVTIHTIGDSTMSSYDQSFPAQKGMDGWGDFLADCLKNDWATVYNWADRGETARSYYNGIWSKISTDRPEFAEPVMNKVQEGDYVIIQFGHNDSKAYSTVQYEQWLSTLVDAVKAKGATPIMAGSICRARFSNGAITRLGRIDTYEDANRIVEDGAEIDDYTFDYPYHAKKVAEAKGIEFIDVTTAVKNMFEEYGEAKTKALFPTGEKTHTNKLGAQLIAKVAAKLLLGTALKNYVKTDAVDLPTADDIAVVIDNFGNEAVVTKKTIWTFNDYQKDDVIASDAEEKQVVAINGVYARGGSNRTITAKASTIGSVTFSDENQTTVPVTIMAEMTSHTAAATTIGTNTAGRQAANALAPTFALNVGTPGTFYAILTVSQSSDDRLLRIIFSGREVSMVAVKDAYAAEKHLCEIKYHAESTGVIYLSAGVRSNVQAMMFIPDMEAGTEEDWNYQMVQTRENGYWTYCNQSDTDQQVPEGLTAYAVSSVSDDGKAMLTDIGDVIPVGMPVIVKGEPNTEYALPVAAAASRSRIAYSGTNLLVKNNVLRYLPETENGKTNYYFDGNQFVRATGGETIHEKQAYLSVEGTAETLTLALGGVTAIQNVPQGRPDGRWYNLAGQQVQPLAKGIYILNGHKYVVK